MRGQTAIVGAAVHGIGTNPGSSATDLAITASVKALADAGLAPGDVDAIFSTVPDDPLSDLTFAGYLGIQPRFTDNNRTGGSSFMLHAQSAALALSAGLCDVALITYGSNQRSGAGGLVRSGGAPFIHEARYKPTNPPTAYALAAARHMHEFGTTRSQLAEVAVAARGWANLNPEAFMQGPLSIDDVLSARPVCDPFTARDCCLVTDGAAAIVMVRSDRAADMPRDPVYLLGSGSAVTHRYISSMPDLCVTGAVDSGKRAFAQAGYEPGDMDVLGLYDAFTINPILFLEDLGFCPKGEGGRFVEGGRIGPGGDLPVNTNGGGLSCVHPGMYGLFAIVEVVEQLRGSAGARQVHGASLALAHGNGGTLSSQATCIFGTAATI